MSYDINSNSINLLVCQCLTDNPFQLSPDVYLTRVLVAHHSYPLRISVAADALVDLDLSLIGLAVVGHDHCLCTRK